MATSNSIMINNKWIWKKKININKQIILKSLPLVIIIIIFNNVANFRCKWKMYVQLVLLDHWHSNETICYDKQNCFGVAFIENIILWWWLQITTGSNSMFSDNILLQLIINYWKDNFYFIYITFFSLFICMRRNVAIKRFTNTICYIK